MAKILLIKGASYTDGIISASRKEPTVEVPDGKVQRYVGTGYFRLLESTEPAAPEEREELFADEAEEKDEAEEPAEAADFQTELSGMTVDELKSFADKKGIDITGLKKKAEIIGCIAEAQEKARESRAALRGD